MEAREEKAVCSLIPAGFITQTSDSESDSEQLQVGGVTGSTNVALFASSKESVDETDNGSPSQERNEHDDDESMQSIGTDSTNESNLHKSNTSLSHMPTHIMGHQLSPLVKINGKDIPVTPTKPMEQDTALDPVTPTANLKILLSAASPDIRERDNRKKELFPNANRYPFCMPQHLPPPLPVPNDSMEVKEEQFSEEEVFDDPCKPVSVSRKDKSLGLLCQRFLSRFPDYQDPNVVNDISLDVIARELSVERRRIYDIVNVLESVEVVSRLAKNKYVWHGKGNLLSTLTKLKALGERENYAQQIVHLKRMQEEREFNFGDDDVKPKKEPLKENEADNVPWKFINMKESNKGLERCNNRKEKSLGVMSQKFIMLFLVSKTKIVSLDIAARILIGDINYEINENSKFKTKIRRLYDIANILTSLQLIKKVHVTEARGRKPAFKWVGPEPESDWNNASSNDASDSTTSTVTQRPATKHSLLDQFTAAVNNNVGMKENDPNQTKLLNRYKQRPFQRHASFQSMCEVVEREHSKLCSSAPSTPTKENNEFNVKLRTEFETLKKSYPVRTSQLFAICKVEQERQEQEAKQSQQKDTSLLKNEGSVQSMQQAIVQPIYLQGLAPNHFVGNIVNTNVGTLQTVTVPVTGVTSSVSLPKQQTIVTVNGLQGLQQQQQQQQSSLMNTLNMTVDSLHVALRDGNMPMRRSKRTVKQILDEEFEYQPVVKRSKIEMQALAALQGAAGNVTSDVDLECNEEGVHDEIDGCVQMNETFEKNVPISEPKTKSDDSIDMIQPPSAIQNIRRKSLSCFNKPSPSRALHHEPEFRSSPVSEISSTNESKTPSPVDGKFDANDLELAFPLQDEDSKERKKTKPEAAKEKNERVPSEVNKTRESTVLRENCSTEQVNPSKLIVTEEAKKENQTSAESSQSFTQSQSPFQLLLNNRSSTNSPARFKSRPSSLSSIAELERVFGNSASPVPPIISPNVLYQGKIRSKSISPSHFQSLSTGRIQQVPSPLVTSQQQSSYVQQVASPLMVSPQQLLQSQQSSLGLGSPAVLSPLGSNLPTPTLLSNSSSPVSMSSSLNSSGNSVFTFNLNQLLSNASSMSQTSGVSTHSPIDSNPSLTMSQPGVQLQMQTSIAQTQSQSSIQMQTQTSMAQIPIHTAPIAMTQTQMPGVTFASLPPTSMFLQTSSAFLQSPFTQWSTPIMNRTGSALLPGMSPIIPSETFSPKTLTPGNTSYQNIASVLTPGTTSSFSSPNIVTPGTNSEMNNSSFFHTPNVFPIMNTGNLVQPSQPNAPVEPSAFQQVRTNLPPMNSGAIRKLTLPESFSNQS